MGPTRRCLRRDEEGVASTVGTIMALLVFLTFLSLITNQYVPVWMKDEEAGHMGEALGQLGNLKTAIDNQILTAETAEFVRREYIPVTTFATIKLGVDGVPIFASPTLGTLAADESAAPWRIWFQYDAGSSGTTTVPEAACGCGGSVTLSVLNRYYPQQSLAYENGALIRAQREGQLIKGEPSFQVIRTNVSTEVDLTLVQMFLPPLGRASITGTGSEGVQARVLSVDLQEYKNIETEVILDHTSFYGPAWYKYFNETVAAAFGVDVNDYAGGSPFDHSETYDASNRPTQLRVENPYFLLQSIYNPATQDYNVTLRFKQDQNPADAFTVLPVGPFRLLHAYVNVRVGERGVV